MINALVEERKWACVDLGLGGMPAKRLPDLDKPLMSKSNPSIVEMLDLIEEFRKAPGLSMQADNACSMGQLHSFLFRINMNQHIYIYTLCV